MKSNDDEIRIPVWLADQLIDALMEESDRLHLRASSVGEEHQQPLRQRADTLSALKGAIWNAKHEQHPHWSNGGTAVDQRHASGNSSIVQLESTKLLPIIMVLCVLVGLSLAGTAWSIAMAFRAQERADLLQLEVESFKNVLHANKLPTSQHLPGESP